MMRMEKHENRNRKKKADNLDKIVKKIMIDKKFLYCRNSMMYN